MTRQRYAILLAVAALLCGCVAERKVLISDRALTADALRQGGLAIVGVTVVDEVEQVRPPLIAKLERTLAESRPDLPFRAAEAVRESLGLAEYRHVLSEYQSSAALDAEALRRLATRIGPGVRFALLARVERNDIRVPQPVRSAEGVPSSFGVNGARRDARIRITLYDLPHASVAWDAVYASSSENALPDSVLTPPEPFRIPIVISPSDDSPVSSPDMLPEAPSLADALAEGYLAFAADLPR